MMLPVVIRKGLELHGAAQSQSSRQGRGRPALYAVVGNGALAAMHLQCAKERSMFDAVNLA